MSWRYYHDGEVATGVRSLTSEERRQLQEIARRPTEQCAWPLALTGLASVFLAASAAGSDALWVIAALFPVVLVGVPAGIHSYQMFRDRRLARLGLSDGRAATFHVRSDRGSVEEVPCTLGGFVLGTSQSIYRYSPPLRVTAVADAHRSAGSDRTLSSEELSELARHAKIQFEWNSVCCLPFIAAPAIALIDNELGPWMLAWSFIIAAAALASIVLLIRDCFRVAKVCRRALVKPVALEVVVGHGGVALAEVLSVGDICWAIDGEPASWRTFGWSPQKLHAEIQMRLEEMEN